MLSLAFKEKLRVSLPLRVCRENEAFPGFWPFLLFLPDLPSFLLLLGTLVSGCDVQPEPCSQVQPGSPESWLRGTLVRDHRDTLTSGP